MESENKDIKKRGRPKGKPYKTKNKYNVQVFDILNSEWKDGGNYPSYYAISDKYNYSYDNIRDIKNGRTNLKKFFKITKL